MILSSLINAKIHLISGILIGVGATMVCKEMCKRTGMSSNKNNTNKHEPGDQADLKIHQTFILKVTVMSVTMYITITTKDGCFDEIHALAKEELAVPRTASQSTLLHRETQTL